MKKSTQVMVISGGFVGALAGFYLPVPTIEHLYIVTDEISEMIKRGSKHPHVMDPACESYLLQEGLGLCI